MTRGGLAPPPFQVFELQREATALLPSPEWQRIGSVQTISVARTTSERPARKLARKRAGCSRSRKVCRAAKITAVNAAQNKMRPDTKTTTVVSNAVPSRAAAKAPSDQRRQSRPEPRMRAQNANAGAIRGGACIFLRQCAVRVPARKSELRRNLPGKRR